MRQTLIVVSLLAVALHSACGQEKQRTQILQLKHGKVSGIVEEVNSHKINFYQGIKFGHANRFEKAKPVAPWSEVYDASSFRDACPQFGGINAGLDNPLLPSTKTHSEDCLYLNVWAPAEHKANRTVMVWIHGGAFEVGTIFTAFFDGKYLAQQGDVVIVSINYRLGPLGWLAGGGVPGNLGLHDQILGLQWVQENIHYFGGDPQQVTIFGESAGSVSVGALVVSPLGKGLFHRAIMQSGAPIAEFVAQSKDKLEAKTKILAHKVHCPTENLVESVTCLRNKTVEQLQEASLNDFAKNEFFGPLHGDDVLPLKPADALKEGKVNHVDLLYGVTRDEGTAFAPMVIPELSKEGAPEFTIASAKADMAKIIKFYGHSEGQEVADYYTAHVKSTASQDELKALVSSVWGDFHLVCPTILFGEQMARGAPNNHYYSYRLMQEIVIPGLTSPHKWEGVAHGQDLLYLFMAQLAALNPQLSELSKDMISAWTLFAKTGHPGKLSTGLQWEEALSKNGTAGYITKIMHLEGGKYKMLDSFFEATCDKFWKPKIIN